MKLEEILLLESSSAINELKSKKLSNDSKIEEGKDQLDPRKHKINSRLERPDKTVKVDVKAEGNSVTKTTGGAATTTRIEKVARIALALQKLIVKRAVSFLFGNPVELDAQPENETQAKVLKVVKRILYDIKDPSLNRAVARTLFSCTEVAEVLYPVQGEVEHNIYGFKTKFKVKSAIFSPLLGDKLYPYFDETGDMIAFSREFTVIDKKSIDCFETYTAKEHYLWVRSSDGFELAEGYPKKITIGKIPVVYGQQDNLEWEDVQELIERLEKLLSNFSDTNDYHASPKIFTQGAVKGFAKKGESGAIIEGEKGSSAQYLSWANAPESVKLEIDTLLRMIYTITQTPDISFESLRGIGNVSGVALKLLFMDAHLKVEDHKEVFDSYLQRRINIILAYIGSLDVNLKAEAENIMIQPVIVPYIIKDEAADLKIWSDANGGEAIISHKASFQKAGLTSDPEADYQIYLEEQASKNTFSLGGATI